MLQENKYRLLFSLIILGKYCFKWFAPVATTISSGFTYGRLEYERLNGPLAFGVPLKIVTDKVLEEFLLAGMLGMGIDADGYTAHQMNILQQWYQSGIEKYDPNESLYLLAFLEHHGIETL